MRYGKRPCEKRPCEGCTIAKTLPINVGRQVARWRPCLLSAIAYFTRDTAAASRGFAKSILDVASHAR
jgi:hypothetical protein